MLKNKDQAFPSHGRGRRFNPCSAHHFTGDSSAELGTDQQQSAPAGTPRRGQDVENVHAAFAALCSSASWPPPVANAAVRLRCSLQSYASHRGHATLWRALKDDFAEFEAAITHSSKASSH